MPGKSRLKVPGRITLAYGSGGRLTHELVSGLFARAFANKALAELADSAEIKAGRERLAFTTDGYVVSPLFFPGGDIGKLAVCGTVNDLAVKGARPLALSASFIIEEGFEGGLLEKAVLSMKAAAAEAGVDIVTGDTKVVDKGKADGLFISTAGVGLIPAGRTLSFGALRTGDELIISGPLGDHGVAVMNARNNLGLSGLRSDCAPLGGMLEKALSAGAVRAMRDLTRGGLATSLNEAAAASGLSIELDEEKVPVSPVTANACALLGLDPLYSANEGKAMLFCPPSSSAKVLRVLRTHRYGRGAVIAGRVLGKGGDVTLRTAVGGSRLLRMLEGEQLPRIC
ncbi:MAG TPA: hydrogenase expression/formation protein HypE [Elusimicrobiales bacterium]|nr:hydrogenase expression/formation protein HypE [Elusimicrobiales bacterium]